MTRTCLIVAGSAELRRSIATEAIKLGYEPIEARLVAHTYRFLYRPPDVAIVVEGELLDNSTDRVINWPNLSRPPMLVLNDPFDIAHVRDFLERHTPRALEAAE